MNSRGDRSKLQHASAYQIIVSAYLIRPLGSEKSERRTFAKDLVVIADFLNSRPAMLFNLVLSSDKTCLRCNSPASVSSSQSCSSSSIQHWTNPHAEIF